MPLPKKCDSTSKHEKDSSNQVLWWRLKSYFVPFRHRKAGSWYIIVTDLKQASPTVDENWDSASWK